jgi:putative hydrolase of the HAD superfamily
MKKDFPITTLFLDVGGVLLTNGWDTKARTVVLKLLDLNIEEFETRHHQINDLYELGKITIEEYLRRVLFYQERPFSTDKFRELIFAQSKPFPEMLNLFRQLKEKYGLRVVIISNEARELLVYRIKTFVLDKLADFFISSCFVGLRKPDTDIFRMALEVAQVEPEHVLFVEDRPMFLQAANDLGIKGILHKNYNSTVEELALWGLIGKGN